MKLKMLLGIGALCLGFFGLVCPAFSAEPASKVDRVVMKDGKASVPGKDGGKLVPLDKELDLTATIKVGTNGTFTVNKGKPRELKEGQVLSKDGMLLSPDGKLEPVIDHAVMSKGKMIIYQDGTGTPLTREITLANGTRIDPSGTVRTFDGKLRRLIEGQMFELNGTVVPAKDTVALLKGTVVVQKEGEQYDIQRGRTIMMNDGTKVFGDGYIVKRDGTKVALAEGQVLTLEGVAFKKPR